MKSFAKKQLFMLLPAALMFNACTNNQPLITGTYVNHAESVFSVADDTLAVEQDKDNHYLIHRKTGFQLMDESGKKGKLQLETEEWKADFDEGSMRMTENRKGRVISFDTAKGLLTLENSTYQRIN